MKTFLRALIAIALFLWFAIEFYLVFGLFVGGGIFSERFDGIAAATAAWTLTGFVLALCAIALR
jgi:hypothetical protein